VSGRIHDPTQPIRQPAQKENSPRDLRKHFISSEVGPALWFPYLEKKESVAAAIGWAGGNPEIEYATMNMESNAGSFSNMWQSKYAKWFFSATPHSRERNLLPGTVS